MRIRSKITSSVLALGAISVLGTATAFAATNTHPNHTVLLEHQTVHKGIKAGSEQKLGVMNGTSNITVIANILGISTTTLKADLQAGQSLAQIAQAQGISEQTLISDIESKEQAQLESAVASSKLMSAQEQKILTNLDARVQRMVEHTWGTEKGLGQSSGSTPKSTKIWSRGGRFFSVSDIVPVLGVSQSTLQTDLKNGETILQVAQSQNSSVTESQLATELTTAYQTQLSQAVTSGNLTSTQETTLLNNFTTHVDQLITTKLDFQGHHQGFHGKRGNEPQTATTSTTSSTTS